MLVLDAEQKRELINLLKGVDIAESAIGSNEKKRKWFRFGAYDALRIATEAINAIPETEEEKKATSLSGIK